ncbi:hypothetical protein GCM10011384_07980 [Psychrobacillus lasiicapitis]|nr:hypothetical protein GCM10011384_07980 [Psychrobacillus lasiicapitis]
MGKSFLKTIKDANVENLQQDDFSNSLLIWINGKNLFMIDLFIVGLHLLKLRDILVKEEQKL